MEKDVWKRVMAGREEGAAGEIRALEGRTQELVAAYRVLAQSLSGRGKELAQQLLSQESDQVATLRGLAFLAGQKGSAPLPVPKGNTGTLVRRCWKTNWELIREYTALSAQPGAGVVFRRLSQHQEAQAERIAQLAGILSSARR